MQESLLDRDWYSIKNSQKTGFINEGIKDRSKKRSGISSVPRGAGIQERK